LKLLSQSILPQSLITLESQGIAYSPSSLSLPSNRRCRLSCLSIIVNTGRRLLDVKSLKTKMETLWLHQPKWIKHLKEPFGEPVKDIKSTKTLAAAKTNIVQSEKGDQLIPTTQKTKYQSGVGMLG
jgi:hypothetical protein